MNPGENILLIRFKSIGDILFMLPGCPHGSRKFPRRENHVSHFPGKNAPLLRGFREVDDIITIHRARFRSGNPGKILVESFALLRLLRGGNFPWPWIFRVMAKQRGGRG